MKAICTSHCYATNLTKDHPIFSEQSDKTIEQLKATITKLEADNKELTKENKDYVKSMASLEKKCKEKVATAEKQVEKYRYREPRSSKSQEASVAASNKLNVKMKSKAAIHTN